MKIVFSLIAAALLSAMPLSAAAVPKAAEDEDGTVVRMDPQVNRPRTGQKRTATFVPSNGKSAAARATSSAAKENGAKKTKKTAKKRKKASKR